MAKSRKALMLAVLSPAYPGVEFTFETMSPSHRNHYNNFLVRWEGGPQADEVETLLRAQAPDTFKSQATKGWGRYKVGFNRSASDAERAAWIAKYEADAPARKAAHEAQKQQNKLNGVKQRAETAVERKALVAKLTERFPGVAFSVRKDGKYRWNVEWTGGPSERAVKAVDRITAKRHDSQVEIDAYNQKAQRAHDRCAARLAELVAIGEDNDLVLGDAPHNFNLERITTRWRETMAPIWRMAKVRKLVASPAQRAKTRNPVKVAARQARRMMRERLSEQATLALQLMLPLDLPPLPHKAEPTLVMLREGQSYKSRQMKDGDR